MSVQPTPSTLPQLTVLPFSIFIYKRPKSKCPPYFLIIPGRRERSGQAQRCEALLQAEAEAEPKPRAKPEPENLRALSMAPQALPRPPTLPAPLQQAYWAPPHKPVPQNSGRPNQFHCCCCHHNEVGRIPMKPACQLPTNHTAAERLFAIIHGVMTAAEVGGSHISGQENPASSTAPPWPLFAFT